MKSDFITKDSGQREEFNTGSRRDTQEGKARFDLLPWGVLERWAHLMGRGAEKYSDHNWTKGQPLMRYYASLQRHLYQWLTGDTSEDHLAAALFNVGGLMFTEMMIKAGRLPRELNDIPEFYRQGVTDGSN